MGFWNVCTACPCGETCFLCGHGITKNDLAFPVCGLFLHFHCYVLKCVTCLTQNEQWRIFHTFDTCFDQFLVGLLRQYRLRLPRWDEYRRTIIAMCLHKTCPSLFFNTAKRELESKTLYTKLNARYGGFGQ